MTKEKKMEKKLHQREINYTYQLDRKRLEVCRMKNYFKFLRNISFIILLSCMSVLTTEKKSQAYTAHTQAEAVNWANAQKGKGLDFDGVYGNQCVDLIKYYYQYLGVGNTYGNGSDYISNGLPSGWTRVYGNYQPGDIAVWKASHSCSTCRTSALGHVGIITSADSVGFNAINQNFNSQSYCTSNWFYCSALACAIRPDFRAADSVRPSISNVRISNVTNSSYTVTCTVSDNVGVTRVLFPSWNTDIHTGNDANWIQGNISGNTASVTVAIGGLKSGLREGTYLTHIYAYDAAGNSACISAPFVYIDRTAPTISELSIVEKDATGYLVQCKASDNKGINRVQCPTWTGANGQDDLAANWGTNTSVRAYQYGEYYRFRVNISEHNNEYGNYYTHVYAYDNCGNSVCAHLNGVVVEKEKEELKTEEETTKPSVKEEPTATPEPTKETTTPNKVETSTSVNLGELLGWDDEEYQIGDWEEEDEDEKTVVGKGKILTLKNLRKKKLRVKVKDLDEADYYEVLCGTNENITKGRKRIRSTKRKVTFKRMKKKTYYVKVRGYYWQRGKRVYGEWSEVKEIEIKK